MKNIILILTVLFSCNQKSTIPIQIHSTEDSIEQVCKVRGHVFDSGVPVHDRGGYYIYFGKLNKLDSSKLLIDKPNCSYLVWRYTLQQQCSRCGEIINTCTRQDEFIKFLWGAPGVYFFDSKNNKNK